MAIPSPERSKGIIGRFRISPSTASRHSDASSRPKFSLGQQLNVPMAAIDESEEDKKRARSDWLHEAGVDMRQDLSTSNKTLSLIRSLLEDIEERLEEQARAATPTAHTNTQRLENRRMLMKACKEYSTSRCHLLKQRIHQVDYWTRIGDTGQEAPDQAPSEWKSADVEWLMWLRDRAKALKAQLTRLEMVGGNGANPKSSRMTTSSAAAYDTEPLSESSWEIWGPLAHIVDLACTLGLEGCANGIH